MERRGIFFTSDWHIGHKNCLELDQRPFRDLNHMHEVLVNNYNACMKEDSICYFLGDMGLCSGETIRSIIAPLKGTKVLCLGNHDKQHEAMYKNGFDVVLNGAVLYIAGQRVSMSHCPILGIYREDTTDMEGAYIGSNWHGEHKQFAYTMADEGQFHLHGHIHSPNRGKSQRILGKQFDVGVVANKYRPVSISEVESWIAKYGR